MGPMGMTTRMVLAMQSRSSGTCGSCTSVAAVTTIASGLELVFSGVDMAVRQLAAAAGVRRLKHSYLAYPSRPSRCACVTFCDCRNNDASEPRGTSNATSRFKMTLGKLNNSQVGSLNLGESPGIARSDRGCRYFGQTIWTGRVR